MNVLGIDPGATTGWCLYDSTKRRVLEAGQFPRWALVLQLSEVVDVAVLEVPKAYGPTRPQVVDCAYVAGRLAEKVTKEDADSSERVRFAYTRSSTGSRGNVEVGTRAWPDEAASAPQ